VTFGQVANQYRLLQDALYASRGLGCRWFLQADLDEVFVPSGRGPSSKGLLTRLLDARAPPDVDFVSVRSRKVAHALAGETRRSGAGGRAAAAAPTAAPNPSVGRHNEPPTSPSGDGRWFPVDALAQWTQCFRSPTDVRLRDACDAPLAWLIGASDFGTRPTAAAAAAVRVWGASRPPLKRAAADAQYGSSSAWLAPLGKPSLELPLEPVAASRLLPPVPYERGGRLRERDGSTLRRVAWHSKYACKPERTDAALVHFPWKASAPGAVGVDAHPSELVLMHFRMAMAAHQPPQHPRHVCASAETRTGQCGASGRAANASCGFGWCCLVPCAGLAEQWSGDERAHAIAAMFAPS
jgi:hypothetical protein